MARAYRELERDGVVVSNGRRGTTVLAPPEADPAGGAVEAIAESICVAKVNGVDAATILHLVTRTLAAE